MRLSKFYDNIQRDLKLFAFLLVLLCLYRIVFMVLMSSYMADGTSFSALVQANGTGLRLSLKSAAGMMAVSFLFVTIPGLIRPSWSCPRLRLAIGTVESLLLAILFEARFPYYREFGQTYGMQVMQGAHDDRAALFVTMVQEYGLPWRLAIALALTAACWYVLRYLLVRQGTFSLPYLQTRARRIGFTVVLVLGMAFFALFTRFGAGVNYATGINWENAAVTEDDFLNECVLDDIQALYRAQSFEKKMQAGDIHGVDRTRVRTYAQQAAGHTDLTGTDLKPYLARTAQGARIAKPKHIFIVLGESWAQWPMLPKYENLHVADGIRSLAASPNGYYTSHFMPNGDFTSAAICGVLTGLVDVNVRPNYQPRSFEEPYPTALAAAFQGLGYQVDFWYGGTPGWDSIKKLAIAQGFDHFYGYPDYHAPKTNTWGTKDGNLFAALEEHLADEPPTVHVIMTTSNHPPYNIDLEAEGFDLAREEQAVRELIPDAADPAALAKELGHYWYMDKIVTAFVWKTQETYPDSVFVITGDHAVRTDPGPHPTTFEHQSVPFVLYGAGITPQILPAGAVGGHTSIAPTLVELIAPQGYTYYSLAAPMTDADAPQRAAFNREAWVTDRMAGSVDSSQSEPLPESSGAAPDAAAERAKLDAWLPMLRTLSWWMLTQGTELPAE